MKKISVFVPCHNEELSLPLLYKELHQLIVATPQYDWELLFVNDGSEDNTLAILKELRKDDTSVNYIDLSRNFGKEAAMLAGIDHVTGDCMIIMDADLQDPPYLIPQMIEKWEEGYNDVYAKRKTRGKESWIRKRLSMIFYKLLQNTARFDVLVNVGDFRLLDRSCINALREIRESERYTKGMFSWIGFKKYEILFDRQDRIAGVSAWNMKGLFNLAIEGLTSFTTSPLRISTYIGLFVSLGSFAYLLYFLIKTLVLGDEVSGFPTLIITILFLGGVQLLSIGILGEYIGRIFNETKKRPHYLIQEYNNEKVIKQDKIHIHEK